MIRVFTKDTNTELTIIKSTLRINTATDAFSKSIKVYHNKYPFLILEDKNTIVGLGNRHLLSTGRNKEKEVVVQFNRKTFFGKLKILDYLTGARKCDIKFGSDLLSISDKKIADFMPTHYFGDQIPYTETVEEYFDQKEFIDSIEEFSSKQYPEVLFQLPQIKIENYNSEDKDLYDSDHFFNYRNFLSDKKFSLNTRSLSFLNFYKITNKSSFVPMPYLMALIEKPLESIGWKLIGDYKEDALNSKILLVPEVNNNTLLKLNKGYNFNLSDFVGWESFSGENYMWLILQSSELPTVNYSLNINLKNIPKPTAGNVRVNVVLSYPQSNKNFLNTIDFQDKDKIDFNFSVDINLETIADKPGISIRYYHPDYKFPEEHSLQIESSIYKEKDMILYHPTVDLKRYVPDWTFTELLNNLKEFQNLKSTINETTKTIRLDYNQKYITNFNFVNLNEEAIRITGFKNNDGNDYEVIFANQEPSKDKNVSTIQNKFKINYSTLEKFKEDGLTLALYESGIYTTESISEKTLLLDQSNNSLFHLNFKDWLTFKKNASPIKAEAYLSHTKILEIESKQKVFFNSIMYAVKNMTYDLGEQLNQVTLELKNIIGISNSAEVLLVEKTITIISVELIAPDNSVTGSFLWGIKVKYSIEGFNSFNGQIFSKKLTQNPNLGVVYDGLVFGDTNISNTSEHLFYIPDNTNNYNGWQEIQISYDGVESNKIYLEIDTFIDLGTNDIILTKINNQSTVTGYFDITLNGIDPLELTLLLQEFEPVTGSPIGAPIKVFISDLSQNQFEVNFPYSSSWKLTSSLPYTSNTIHW